MTESKTALHLALRKKAVIVSIKQGPLTTRLMAMGIIPDRECTILRIAPFGGAKILGMENHQIALRDEELDYIFIKEQSDISQ